MPLHLYHEPVKGHLYCYGLDSSRGGGGDNSVLDVLDASVSPPTEVVCLRSNKLDAMDLAKNARDLHDYGYEVARGNKYIPRSGGLVPEITGDKDIVHQLQSRFDLDFWYVQEKEAKPRSLEPVAVNFGFHTSEASKTTIVSFLHACLVRRALFYSNPWLQDEARYWSRFEGNWKYGLASGHSGGHGDVTMAIALALAGVVVVQENAGIAPFCREAQSVRVSQSYWEWEARSGPWKRQGHLAAR